MSCVATVDVANSDDPFRRQLQLQPTKLTMMDDVVNAKDCLVLN